MKDEGKDEYALKQQVSFENDSKIVVFANLLHKLNRILKLVSEVKV